jgi:hypothetical protein
MRKIPKAKRNVYHNNQAAGLLYATRSATTHYPVKKTIKM